MARINRRKLLALSGAGAVAAKTGGIAAILALGGRPPTPRPPRSTGCAGTISFPPPTRSCARRSRPNAEKALGIKLNIETINGNDIQARTTSAIQSGSGPDVICGLNNWPQLYAESVVDVSDVVEEIGKAQGGFYEESRVVANDGKKWIAVPWCVLGAQIVYRKSWFAEIGSPPKFPQTWEEYRDGRQEAQGEGPPDRADARPHLRRSRRPSPIRICGHGAARRSRRTARRWC